MPAKDESRDWRATLDDPDAPLYTVGVVAELCCVDPQVVRGYDRRGLVSPTRSESGQRRYSRRDVERLSRAMALASDGVSTAGIERVLDLEARLSAADDGASGGQAEPAGRRRSQDA